LIARSVAAKVDAVCVREIQKSIKQSVKKLVDAKIRDLGVSDQFESLDTEIRSAKGGVIVFQGMQDHTADSIKSLEDFDIAWVEEAQSLSPYSLTLLRPTIRKPGSELWFSWNPRRKTDAVDELLRGEGVPTGAVVVKANWRDNPWFPAELEQERLDDFRDRPEQYDHIWEGDYAKVSEGAYYAKALTQAKADGRIGKVAFDPLMTVRLFVDIGGTGARADAFAMWPTQFIGREIRVRDYYEAVGQPLDAHLAWLRAKGYTPDRAQFWLPHDGASNDKVYSVSYESALRQAGYHVTIVPNQGRGAAAARIEAARRIFPSVWFDEETTEPGRDALGAYHEKRDEARNIGLGPEHDWASHGSDAFGLMAVAYTPPGTPRPSSTPRRSYHGEGSWMS
jgi:phage terminase large subunit